MYSKGLRFRTDQKELLFIDFLKVELVYDLLCPHIKQ